MSNDGSNMFRIVTVQYDEKGNKTSKVKTNDKKIVVGSIVEVHRTLIKDSFYSGGKPLVCWQEATVIEVDSKYGGKLENLDFITRVFEYKTDFVPNDYSKYYKVKTIDKNTIEIQKNGGNKKFKKFIIPYFPGKNVIIANKGFTGFKIGTLVIEANIISVGKDAFKDAIINKIENYKNVIYENIECDVFRLNILRMALKDYKPSNSKNYLKWPLFKNDIFALLNQIDNKSFFPTEKDLVWTIDRLKRTGLFDEIDFASLCDLPKLVFFISSRSNLAYIDNLLNSNLCKAIKANYYLILDSYDLREFPFPYALVFKNTYLPWKEFTQKTEANVDKVFGLIRLFINKVLDYNDDIDVVDNETWLQDNPMRGIISDEELLSLRESIIKESIEGEPIEKLYVSKDFILYCISLLTDYKKTKIKLNIDNLGYGLGGSVDDNGYIEDEFLDEWIGKFNKLL